MQQANRPQEQETSETKKESGGRKAPGAFRTISEVADELKVQQHVLRFWETKFTQIKPLKRGGGRRYYRPEDVTLLRKIHHLLYTEGYTIKGVQKILRGTPKSQIAAEEMVAAAVPAPVLTATRPGAIPPAAQPQARQIPQEQKAGLNGRQRAILEAMLGDLKDLRAMIRGQE